VTASAEQAVLDATLLTAHYEALRAQAVGEPCDTSSARGLAVFLRHGLAAWLALCGELLVRPVDAPAQRALLARPRGQTPGPVPTREAVHILARMALAAARKGSP
jgi:hypothetical protein